MAYWLIKTEPDVWSFDMQTKKGAKGEAWTGVRNPAARTHLMSMKKGDRALFYHTGDAKEIAGIAEVIKAAYLDPTDKEGKWVAVNIKAVAALPQPVTLARCRAEKKLADMVLVNNSRLSVQPVTEAEWKIVCKMGGLK